MFADVLIPIARQSRFTYRVPENICREIKEGQQVLVPFGKRFYGAIVLKIHQEKPDYELKEILRIWDEKPLVNMSQIHFWEWLSDYYMCEMGEVMLASLPAGFRIESEMLLDLQNAEYKPINTVESEMINQLLASPTTIAHLVGSDEEKLACIQQLIARQVLVKKTSHTQRFRPKKQLFLLPQKGLSSNEIDTLSTLQQHVMYRLLDLVEQGEVTQKKLLAEEGVTLSPIKTLVKHGHIVLEEKEVCRESYTYPKQVKPLHDLSLVQKEKLEEIQNQFEQFQTVLLHGITSSGKTEIYTHLIAENLEKGKSVLYLLPEIALTTQLADRLAQFFGRQMLVYHSRYNDNERVEIWKKLQENTNPYLIIGARSAVFLPFENLGLVIVDEEHEGSFKQQDPAPRYHGRDAGVYLGYLHKAKVLLGSATPSLESYFNVHLKKYGLVTLNKRYKNIQPPEIILANMAEASRKKRMKGLFTPELFAEIHQTLERGEQVILFQNRRGYAYFVKCEKCDEIPHCPYCDVSLSLHKYTNTLRCHYCNHQASFSTCKCTECGATEFKPIGIGTEQIEEQVAKYFPTHRSDRLDMDTTTGKNSYAKILDRFARGQTDILIGTQMLAKGLDFGNVGLVGVLNADLMLHFPDFRAFERSFQLLTQVSGRAGRKNKQGKVMIQTYKPEHPILKLVQENYYKSLYDSVIVEREQFGYPPVYRMINIRMKHKKYEVVNKASELLGERLKSIFGRRTYGAHTPLVSRISSYYIKEVTLKIERTASYDRAKVIILKEIENIRLQKGLSGVHFGCDADVY